MVEMEGVGLVAQVGRNITARRKQLEMRQDELAAHAPALKKLEKLAEALSISPEELLKAEKPLPPTDVAILESYITLLLPENKSFVVKSLKELSRHLVKQQST